MTINSQRTNISSAAKKILKDGKLLETTEALALKISNNYDFARRINQEFSLIIAGQTIKYLNVGQLDRAYSHAGIYAPPGLGKDFAWKLIRTSRIFPNNIFRVSRLENITQAVLVGTITESTIIPPAPVTEDIIFVGEYATLMKGRDAETIAADMRAMIENGEYRRRLAKVGGVREILETDPDSRRAKYIRSQLEECRKFGLTIDLRRSEIQVRTTTSWLISSARFGSETGYGKSLLSMGDINRYRWRSYLPRRSERRKITSEVGSLPPIDIGIEKNKNSCNEAWRTLISALKANIVNGLKVPRDTQSYYERKKVWDETQKLLDDNYGDKVDDRYFGQLVNLRMRAEYNRIMYQHAVLKQFERNQGYDFSLPTKFAIDYKEDGAFAKQLWISEYVPSMIDVMNDITKRYDKGTGTQETLTSRGATEVLKRLTNGPAKRRELIKVVEKIGISDSLLDNQILPRLLKSKQIQRDKFGVYSLVKNK